MLIACTFPVGVVIASRTPSRNCGPFGGQQKFYDVVTNLVKDNLSAAWLEIFAYLFSPGIIVPVMILFILVIYFLFSLVKGLREANNDLSKQLMHERSEEKKEIFKLARGDRRAHKPGHNGAPLTHKVSDVHAPNGHGAGGYPSRNQSFRSTRGTPYHSSEDDTPSPTKSPVSPLSPTRFGSQFHPSLQSVDEVDNDEDELNQRTKLLEQADIEAQTPKIRFTWKQQILICIGLEDPKKLQRRLQDERDEKEHEERFVAVQTHPPKRRVTAMEPLEEASYSVDSEAEDETGMTTSQQTATSDEHSPYASGEVAKKGSRNGLRRSKSRTKSRSPWSDKGEMEIRQPPTRQSNWLEPPPPTRRSNSMNDRRQLKPPFSRDPASESSPLLARRELNLPLETTQLAAEKRSPQTPRRNGVGRTSSKSPHRSSSTRHSKSPGRHFRLPVAVSIHPQGQPPEPSLWDHAER
jgi:hypothetical protein